MGLASSKNGRARKSPTHFRIGRRPEKIGRARYCIKQSWKQHRACPILCWWYATCPKGPHWRPPKRPRGPRGGRPVAVGRGTARPGGTSGSQGGFSGGPRGIDDPSGGPERGPAGGAVRLAQIMRRPPVRFNGAPGAALSRARVAPPLGALSELSRGPSRGLWRAPRARPGALRGAVQGVGFLRPPSDEPLKGFYDGLTELYQGLQSASPSPPLPSPSTQPRAARSTATGPWLHPDGSTRSVI